MVQGGASWEKIRGSHQYLQSWCMSPNLSFLKVKFHPGKSVRVPTLQWAIRIRSDNSKSILVDSISSLFIFTIYQSVFSLLLSKAQLGILLATIFWKKAYSLSPVYLLSVDVSIHLSSFTAWFIICVTIFALLLSRLYPKKILSIRVFFVSPSVVY